MKGKAIIPLIAGLCVGGVALKLGWSTLQKAQGAQPELTQVWTVKEGVERGVEIQDAMLAALKFPAQYVPADAVKKKEDLVGRVPRTETAAGLPILESMLHPKGTPPGIYVPPGLRAVAVKIDEGSGVDYHIEPGSHVDVVGYFMTRRDSKQEIIARNLIENVQVAAVGQKLQAGADEPSDKGGKAKPARAVTLLVKPEFVPKLHLAEQRGKIKLSLRNENEGAGDNATTAKTSEDDILGLPRSTGTNMMDQLSALFASRHGTPEKAPTPAVAPEIPAVPLPPPPAWVMNVWNGADRQRLGWAKMDSIDAITLEVEQQDSPAPRRRAAPAPRPTQPTEPETKQSAAGATEKEDDSRVDEEPEPEELPE